MLLHLEEDPDDLPAKCLVMNDDGVLPTCTMAGDGEWHVSYPASNDPLGDGGGGGGGFAALFVLALLVGIGFTIWKVIAARDMASRSGMDPNEATAMTLLTDDGFEATYLASNLRGEVQPRPPIPPPASAARLQELLDLKEQGLITEAEYAARRQAIIDAI